MKPILIILLASAMACIAPRSYGAFVISSAAKNEAPAARQHKSKITQLHDHLHTFLHPNGRETKKGVFGTLALIFGILSFIPFAGMEFGVAAIVMGILGMRRHQKYSRIGLILGIVGLVVSFVLTIVIVASLINGLSFVVF